MSTVTAPSSVSTSPTAKGMWRSGRGILLVALLVLATALVPVLLSSPGTEDRRLDPGDSSDVGAQALAELLGRRGVTVVRVESVFALLAAAGPDSQLLITDTGFLTDYDARRIAGSGRDRLIVGAVRHLDILAKGVLAKEHVRARSREPRCDLRQAARAGSAYLGGASFTAPAGSTGCYPAAGRPTLVRYALDGGTVTVAGDGSFMTNLRLAEDGNAALAMNLAGARPRLIWLATPKAGDSGLAGPEGRSLGDFIPAGVGWAIVQLAVAVGVVALWRGRRLGPVVAERLPVVVRASETVEGRGRLYRARRARDRAALALRGAAIDRLAPRLGLPPTASPEEVVAAAAARTGRDAPEVRSALYGPAPVDDGALVALAGYLDTLERQVRDS
ncbi:DUF4350 domain-containing protein [Microtetraspora sp. NBRC 16547]|uniref:DUF4350 domain-containing protein n=1 Tax=Microtetraspora sp. NBRC 16547 TaxID=3030993 RepID=UPI0024A25C33|nr:DUF4350 domain-containing protein [Microtetraspora sp. NBRC 16547]GLW96006.1 hypothetical protein Misp02_00930 [Microtetraspora sp. NBRC 16547]